MPSLGTRASQRMASSTNALLAIERQRRVGHGKSCERAPEREREDKMRVDRKMLKLLMHGGFLLSLSLSTFFARSPRRTKAKDSEREREEKNAIQY